jgi:Rha family phage regulatory protein
MSELVCLKNDQALADSVTVSEMFGKEHAKVMRSIDNLVKTLAKNGERHQMFFLTQRKAADGQNHRIYFMNRDGFSLLVMGFTGKKALEWKLKYIDAFNAMEKIVTERRTTAWIETRKQGMLVRKDETDVIQKLVEYAKEQGSGHADMLYVTYTKLANKMAGITKRNEATTAQLNDLSTMERLIAKVVLDGMAAGLHYKEIYKNCKERLETVKGWLIAS